MPFIIDGHNLLWCIQTAEEDKSITEVALCRILDSFFRQISPRRVIAEIIFDGPGPLNKQEFEAINNLDVTFSGRSCDCDTIIENRILASTAPKQLTIVSTDRRLRGAAEARKANPVKSEDFWDQVKKQLSRPRKSKEPAGKRKGLTQSETELWLREFGIKQ